MGNIERCDRCGSSSCCDHWRGQADKWQSRAGAAEHEHEEALRQLEGAVEALAELQAWASRMPDAGFTSDDPRWDWWHERPRAGGQ